MKWRGVGAIAAFAIVILALLLLLRGGASCRADEEGQLVGTEPTLRTVLLGINHNLGQVESAAGVLTADDIPRVGSTLPDGTELKERHLVFYWLFQGVRFREEKLTLNEEGRREAVGADGSLMDGVLGEWCSELEVTACDGEHDYLLRPLENIAMVYGHGVVGSPARASSVAVGLGLWREEGQTHNSLVSAAKEMLEKAGRVVEREEVDGRECIKIQSPVDTEGTQYRWWVCPDTGFLVLKRERERSGTRWQGARYLMSEVSEPELFGDSVWLPRRIETTYTKRPLEGTEVVERKTVLRIETMQLNPKLDQDMFRIRLPLSARVHAGTKGWDLFMDVNRLARP